MDHLGETCYCYQNTLRMPRIMFEKMEKPGRGKAGGGWSLLGREISERGGMEVGKWRGKALQKAEAEHASKHFLVL